MRIVNEINTILEAQKTAGLIAEHNYLTPSKHNVQVAKDGLFPRAMFVAITDRQINIIKSHTKETADVTIDYVTRSGLKTTEFNAQTMEAKIDAMGSCAVDLIARIMQVSTLTINTDNIELISLYDFMDTNLTGVRMRFSISEVVGECITIQSADEN